MWVKLKKLYKDIRFRALACALGGVIIFIMAFLLFRFVTRRCKDKSRMRENFAEVAANEGVVSSAPRSRPLSPIKDAPVNEEKEEEEIPSSTSSGHINDQKKRKRSSETKPQKKPDYSQPPPPISEDVKRAPESCDEWKAELETLLSKFDRNADASEVSQVSITLNKMFEVCNLPKEPLKDYLRKDYESKRETCLEAKVAGENDLKELKRLLEGLQVVDASYKDDSLELWFVEKFVLPFVTPFEELEMSTFGVDDDANFAALVREANKAFPLARIFAPFVPSNAPQELNIMCNHASFKHLSLIAYLEHIIPKLKDNAKDANSEAIAQKHIRMLRLLKPKSTYVKESLDTHKKDNRPPISSYFEIPPMSKPTVEFLDVNEVKDMPDSKLEEIRNEISEFLKNNSNDVYLSTDEYKIRKSNLGLLNALIASRSMPQNDRFNAWMNTGFKTICCRAFVAWVRNVMNNHEELTAYKYLKEQIRDMHKYKSFSGLCENYIEEQFQHRMADIVWIGIRANRNLEPDFSQKLLRFFNSNRPAEVKDFFNSHEEDATFDMIWEDYYLPKPDSSNTDVEFFCNMIYLMSGLRRILTTRAKESTEFGARLDTLKESDKPEDVYIWWTDCVNDGNEEQCLKQLKLAEQQNFYEQRIEDLEIKYKRFKDTGLPEVLKYGYKDFIDGKFGLLVSFHAYINMQDYLRNVNVSDLKDKASSAFGLTSLDASNLSVQTYVKNQKIHQELSEYFKYCSLEKDWKSFPDIMRSLLDNRDSLDAAKQKCTLMLNLQAIFGECQTGKICKFDRKTKKISCNPGYHTSALEFLGELKGEMASLCQDLLEEAMQTEDLGVIIEKVKEKWKQIQSNMEVELFPNIAIQVY